MPNTVLGKVSVVPKGDYSASTTYYALDIVGYNGGSYLAMQQVTGVTPSNDGVNWMQLSGPGLPGQNGTNGVTFTPSVSEAGVISWTNDGEEENPDPVDIMGPPGTAAGFGTVTATADNTSSETPSVDVQSSGPDTAKNFTFAFTGLKGNPGETPDIEVGTVTTLEPGQDATADITGTTPNLTLSLGIPKGQPGTSISRIERTSGTGAAGTTDTYTMYDSNDDAIGTFTVYNGANGAGAGDMMADGSVPMTGALNMGGNRVTNVGAPTAGTDAVRQSDLQAVSDEVDHILDGTTPVAIPAATEAKVGGIKPGTGLEVEADGTANVTLTGVPDGGTMGQILTQGASGPEWEDAPDTGVTKFNGRTGEVEPQEGDYTASMVGARPDTWTPSASDVGAIPASQKGAASGVAELDSTGRVPSAQLPSYVDDVIEVTSYSALPNPGEDGKIYITEDTNLQYRWSGTQYVEISPSLALGETSSTAYRGDRGKTAYDHSQTTGNPHNTTAADVGARPNTWTPTASEVGAIANPTGGTTGQILEKTATGTQWADKPSGGMTQTEADARYLQLSGGTMTGDIVMGGISKLRLGSASNAPYWTVNNLNLKIAQLWNDDDETFSISVGYPVTDYCATPKSYVDSLAAKSTTVTLTTSGWSSNTQTVTVSGVSADETAQLIMPVPALASQTAYYEAGILVTGQAANSLTFTCSTVPSSNLTVYVVMQEVQ